jgi:hypothetical protein
MRRVGAYMVDTAGQSRYGGAPFTPCVPCVEVKQLIKESNGWCKCNCLHCPDREKRTRLASVWTRCEDCVKSHPECITAGNGFLPGTEFKWCRSCDKLLCERCYQLYAHDNFVTLDGKCTPLMPY